MIVILLWGLSLNYSIGWKWYEYKETVSYNSFLNHSIEMEFKNFLLEVKWEHLDISDGLPYPPPLIEGHGHEHLISIGTFKSYNFKGIKFEPCVNLGTLVFSPSHYFPFFFDEEFVSLILAPSLKIKKRFPDTNLIVGFNPSFYLPIAFFKKHLFTERYFTLFFNIGFVIKEK